MLSLATVGGVVTIIGGVAALITKYGPDIVRVTTNAITSVSRRSGPTDGELDEAQSEVEANGAKIDDALKARGLSDAS